MTALRDLVPKEVTIPCEQTPAVISVDLVVDEHGQVTAPNLDLVKGALAVGSGELVRSQCRMWTRWLARNEQASSR